MEYRYNRTSDLHAFLTHPPTHPQLKLRSGPEHRGEDARSSQQQQAQSPQAGVSRELSIRPVDGGRGYALAVEAGSERVEIVLSPQELVLIKHLVNTALPWVTGWQMNLDARAFDPSVHLAPGPEGGE